ncbi:MAG: hypothetical protein HZC29_08800 [Thaumarchaeota archaeon]|nr:hypothetical protein [Nitrososphaerota archaeon]
MKIVLKKSKLKFIQSWVFPEDVVKFIHEYLIPTYNINEEEFCHVFCGQSKIGYPRIDIEPNNNPDIIEDCLNLPHVLGLGTQKRVLADPPWEISYPQRRAFSYALRDITEMGGIIIINAPWSPWVKGLELLDVVKVVQNFNSYRDLVDFWIFKRVE